MSSQPTPPSQSPHSSDEPKVVPADGAAQPTFEERAQVFWIENKRTILLTCALVLAVLIGKELVVYYLEQRERATGAEFVAAENNPAKLRAFVAAHSGHQLAGLAWLALGDTAIKENKYSDAATAYDKAVALTTGTPFAGRALVGRAFSQALAGDKTKAEASFKSIAADAALASGARAEAQFHLAVLALEAGRADDARKALDEVEAIDREGAWARRVMLLRAGLPAAATVPAAAAAAPSTDAEPKLNLPGSN